MFHFILRKSLHKLKLNIIQIKFTENASIKFLQAKLQVTPEKSYYLCSHLLTLHKNTFSTNNCWQHSVTLKKCHLIVYYTSSWSMLNCKEKLIKNINHHYRTWKMFSVWSIANEVTIQNFGIKITHRSITTFISRHNTIKAFYYAAYYTVDLDIQQM